MLGVQPRSCRRTKRSVNEPRSSGSLRISDMTLMGLCPLLAQSGHRSSLGECPLLGVERTSQFDDVMSAYDPCETCGIQSWCICEYQVWTAHLAGRARPNTGIFKFFHGCVGEFGLRAIAADYKHEDRVLTRLTGCEIFETPYRTGRKRNDI